MSTKKKTITLLGKRFTVRCPVGKEEELERSVQLLSEQLKETQSKSGLYAREDIIMMTALNLCHQQLHNVNKN